MWRLDGFGELTLAEKASMQGQAATGKGRGREAPNG